jgi:hypothetical protein
MSGDEHEGGSDGLSAAGRTAEHERAGGTSGLMRRYEVAGRDDDARLCRDIPESQCREQPRNFLHQVLAQTLSKSGDALTDSKVMLPWLLGVVGAPVFFIGLVVPIRESLALIPQIVVGGAIRRFPVRKHFWSVSSVVEGLCAALMGVAAFSGLTGAAAGWAILALLVVFSLARGVASIGAKDTLGKTVSKGRRGRVGGYASTAAGLAAAALGAYLAISPESARPDWLLSLIFVAAGVCWVLGALSYERIAEYPGATEGGRGLSDLLGDQMRLLLHDRELRKFIAARGLMISTALAGPVYVGLAQRESGLALDSLGWLVVATGIAGFASASVWGVLSDRSSRLTMAVAAGMSGILGLALLAALRIFPGWAGDIYVFAGFVCAQAIAHAGVRIGRKTHVVDLSGGNRKAEYVALSNTVIGVVLLAMGGVTGALLSLNLEVGVLALSAAALLGAVMALGLRDVQA